MILLCSSRLGTGTAKTCGNAYSTRDPSSKPTPPIGPSWFRPPFLMCVVWMVCSAPPQKVTWTFITLWASQGAEGVVLFTFLNCLCICKSLRSTHHPGDGGKVNERHGVQDLRGDPYFDATRRGTRHSRIFPHVCHGGFWVRLIHDFHGKQHRKRIQPGGADLIHQHYVDTLLSRLPLGQDCAFTVAVRAQWTRV